MDAKSAFCSLRGIYAIKLDPAADVLEPAHAKIREFHGQLVRYIFPHRRRNDDFAGRAKLMDPCRNIDSIADQSVAIDDNVLHIDSEAQRQPDGSFFLPWFSAPPLHLERPAHCSDRARKFHQHRVAGNLEQSAPVLTDGRLKEIRLQRLPGAQRLDVALLDQA
jgi:hypothetical protein